MPCAADWIRRRKILKRDAATGVQSGIETPDTLRAPETASALRRWRPFWYWPYRAARLLLVAYATILACLYFFQDGLIFPGSSTQGAADARVQPGTASLLALETASGDTVYALFGAAQTREGEPRPDAASRPTVLFFYGNAMCLARSGQLFQDFRRLGYNVMIPEYTGYGMSGGVAGERGCYETAEAAFDHLAGRTDVDPGRIVVAGWSLGAGVAVELATRKPVAGLAIFSPFTSMADMAALSYPYVPAALLLAHRFENEEKIAAVRRPIFIAHGDVDDLVPYHMSGELERAAGGPVTSFTVAGAGHNNLFRRGGRSLFEAFASWADSAAGS